MTNDKAGNGEAKHGGDVHERAVDLCLRRAPLMVEQGGISRTASSLGTHAMRRATSGIATLVLQQFVAIDAEKLAGRPPLEPFETLPHGSGERATLHLPELGNLDPCWVNLEGCTHR